MVPDPPQDVLVDSKGSRVVNISWRAGFDGNSEILNYTVAISEDNQTFSGAKCQGLSNGACVVSGFSTSASLEDLLPWTTYFIEVFATNKVGSGRRSSVVNTTTDEEGTLFVSFYSKICGISLLVNYCMRILWIGITGEILLTAPSTAPSFKVTVLYSTAVNVSWQVRLEYNLIMIYLFYLLRFQCARVSLMVQR